MPSCFSISWRREEQSKLFAGLRDTDTPPCNTPLMSKYDTLREYLRLALGGQLEITLGEVNNG
jgi:hypothetical protein